MYHPYSPTFYCQLLWILQLFSAILNAKHFLANCRHFWMFLSMYLSSCLRLGVLMATSLTWSWLKLVWEREWVWQMSLDSHGMNNVEIPLRTLWNPLLETCAVHTCEPWAAVCLRRRRRTVYIYPGTTRTNIGSLNAWALRKKLRLAGLTKLMQIINIRASAGIEHKH